MTSKRTTKPARRKRASRKGSKYGDYAKTGKALEDLYAKLAKHRGQLRGLAIPWFTAQSWPRLLRVAADRWNLPDTFEEFERSAGKRFDDFVAQGHPCERVMIDVDRLVAWCREQGRPVDGPARAAFAALTLAQRDRGAGRA
jgi:hypothetical protein